MLLPCVKFGKTEYLIVTLKVVGVLIMLWLTSPDLVGDEDSGRHPSVKIWLLWMLRMFRKVGGKLEKQVMSK